jgi:hypothetical protein
MQEFSSVTASSYDADSLAPMLAEKSAEGWSVISIVAAGTNIVAYLEREADESAAPVVDESAAGVVDEAAEETAPEIATAVEDEAAPADDATPYVPAAAVAGAGAALAADEPAGWAVAPESDTTDQPAADESLAGLVAEVEAEEAAPAPVAEPEPVAAEPVAAEPAAAEPPAAEPAAAESAVPAGWYADPSGRFELRYWDGTAWTEHVSRAGQQFTDPPVA